MRGLPSDFLPLDPILDCSQKWIRWVLDTTLHRKFVLLFNFKLHVTILRQCIKPSSVWWQDPWFKPRCCFIITNLPFLIQSNITSPVVDLKLSYICFKHNCNVTWPPVYKCVCGLCCHHTVIDSKPNLTD